MILLCEFHEDLEGLAAAKGGFILQTTEQNMQKVHLILVKNLLLIFLKSLLIVPQNSLNDITQDLYK